jgi:hypothetical protein
MPLDLHARGTHDSALTSRFLTLKVHESAVTLSELHSLPSVWSDGFSFSSLYLLIEQFSTNSIVGRDGNK